MLAGAPTHDRDDLLDLLRELARGRHDQGVRGGDVFLAHRLGLASRDQLQRGQGKGGRLARAGLRGSDDVAAAEDLGDGLRLDGGRCGEAEVLDPGEYLLVQPELSKCHIHAP